MKTNELETKRCLLKEITLEDSAQIVAWRGDEQVYRYFKKPVKIDIDGHLQWFNQSYLPNKDRIDFIAWSKGSNQRVGVFSISKVPNQIAEVSYLVDKNFQGMGFASEALDALEKYAIDKWVTNGFIAEIHEDNLKSISFIEKKGYKPIEKIGNFFIFQKKHDLL